MEARQSPYNNLMFKDINVKIQKSHILHDVCGKVQSGEILAVMGPSGSGKTTLLNALVGIYPLLSGELQLNGRSIDKSTRRNIGFVTQKDIFFSNLTLWDCLYFVAMIRLPESMTKCEKLERLNYIVDLLDLRKCLHTVIGSGIGPGLSGGEKKRANIGCEILTNPDIMVLDEPTSGLDSSTAANLMVSLKDFTLNNNKTVIVTLHQPSSRLFHMCTSLLLLIEGHNAYFGPSTDILKFFESIDLHCDPLYNPADFMLEKCKAGSEVTKKIIETANEVRKSPEWVEQFEEKWNVNNSPTEKGINNVAFKSSNGDTLNAYHINLPIDHEEMTDVKTRPHQTSLWNQYKWISWRWFKHFKKKLFSPLTILQQVFITVVICMLWYNIERSPETVKDRMGFFFLTSAHWSFTTNAITIELFPEERPIFRKERRAGYYTCLPYYLALMTSELPLIILMPILTFTIQYWVIGLHGVAEYFLSLLMLLIFVLFIQFTRHQKTVSETDRKLAQIKIIESETSVLFLTKNMQALTFLVSNVLGDYTSSLLTMNMLIMFGLMAGGFYVVNVPSWIRWTRYLSVVQYPFSFMSLLEFSDLNNVNCVNTSVFQIAACADNTSAVRTSEDILRDVGIDMPSYFYPLVMFVAFVVFRISGYYVFKNRK